MIFWPSIFKDANNWYQSFDWCQIMGNQSKKWDATTRYFGCGIIRCMGYGFNGASLIIQCESIYSCGYGIRF